MTPLNPEDFERGQKLSSDDRAPPKKDEAQFSPFYFEGDILGPLVSNQTSLSLYRRQKSLISFILNWILQKGRNAVKDMSAKWPEGRIPYVLSRRFSDHDRSVLAAAIQTYNDKTCIRFEAKNSTDSDFVYIYPGSGCASQVGRGGGMQYVSLGVGCLYVGIAQHELMHVTGFWHEQSRADRDDHIRILWDNIEPGMEYNFDKYTWNDIQSLEEPYDLGSVMHYGTHAFAKGFGPTIVPKDGSSLIMGQRAGLSETDLEKINKLYGCTQYLKKSRLAATNLASSNNAVWAKFDQFGSNQQKSP